LIFTIDPQVKICINPDPTVTVPLNRKESGIFPRARINFRTKASSASMLPHLTKNTTGTRNQRE
jgi:hypothetical protein